MLSLVGPYISQRNHIVRIYIEATDAVVNLNVISGIKMPVVVVVTSRETAINTIYSNDEDTYRGR